MPPCWETIDEERVPSVQPQVESLSGECPHGDCRQHFAGWQGVHRHSRPCHRQPCHRGQNHHHCHPCPRSARLVRQRATPPAIPTASATPDTRWPIRSNARTTARQGTTPSRGPLSRSHAEDASGCTVPLHPRQRLPLHRPRQQGHPSRDGQPIRKVPRQNPTRGVRRYPTSDPLRYPTSGVQGTVFRHQKQ